MTAFKKGYRYFSHGAHRIVYFVGMRSTRNGAVYEFRDICDVIITRSHAEVEKDIVDYEVYKANR